MKLNKSTSIEKFNSGKNIAIDNSRFVALPHNPPEQIAGLESEAIPN